MIFEEISNCVGSLPTTLALKVTLWWFAHCYVLCKCFLKKWMTQVIRLTGALAAHARSSIYLYIRSSLTSPLHQPHYSEFFCPSMWAPLSVYFLSLSLAKGSIQEESGDFVWSWFRKFFCSLWCLWFCFICLFICLFTGISCQLNVLQRRHLFFFFFKICV